MHRRYIGLALALAGCLPPAGTFYTPPQPSFTPPPTPAAPAAPAPAPREGDELLAAEAARLAGGDDVAAVVAGSGGQAAFEVAAEAGHCYDLAVVASEAAQTQVLVNDAHAVMRYPLHPGTLGDGRSATLTVCADSSGALALMLTAHAPAPATALRFAVAARRRVETPDQRSARLAEDRGRFEARERALCEALPSSSTSRCLDALARDLAERDRRAAAR